MHFDLQCKDVKVCVYFVVFLSLFFVLTLFSASPFPDDQDGVNFLLGIERYGIAFHQPHFPGYPVYIAACKIINIFTWSTEQACILISAISGTFCLLLMALTVQRYSDPVTTFLCIIALAANTVFFEFSHKYFTEIPALALLFLAIFFIKDFLETSDIEVLLSGVALGLMLGVRLSWWPYPFFYILYSLKIKKYVPLIGGLMIGVFVWFLPQMLIVGMEDFFSIGFSFTEGHFTQWGGAVGSGAGGYERLVSIFMRIGELMGWIGTGMPWTRLSWILFGIFCFIEAIKSKSFNIQIKIYLFASLFYFIWVILGQNTEKVRHFIPLLPAVIFVISTTIERYKKIAVTILVIFFLTLVIDYSTRTNVLPPAAQLGVWTETLSLPDAVFYCGNSERFFDRYPSDYKVVSVKNNDGLDFAMKATWSEPSARFVCSDIPGFSTEQEPVKVFYPRKGDPVDQILKIYRTGK